MNFSDLDLLERLLQKPNEIDKSSISNQHASFQIKGNNIFHLYSLNPEKLELLIEYFSENNTEALKALLIK